MKTIPSSELVRIAMQDVADYFNGEPGASERVDEDALEIGRNAAKFRGYGEGGRGRCGEFIGSFYG